MEGGVGPVAAAAAAAAPGAAPVEWDLPRAHLSPGSPPGSAELPGNQGVGAVPLYSAFQVEGSELGKRSRRMGEAGRGADTSGKKKHPLKKKYTQKEGEEG